MSHHLRASFGLLCLPIVLMLAGCTAAAPATVQPATASPVALAVEESTVTPEQPTPTDTLTPENTPEQAVVLPTATQRPAQVDPLTATPAPDWLQTVTVEGDYYVLDNPSAPVRLLDYSDFF